MQDYLGHRDPRHTVHYTRVAGRRFEGLWKSKGGGVRLPRLQPATAGKPKRSGLRLAVVSSDGTSTRTGSRQPFC